MSASAVPVAAAIAPWVAGGPTDLSRAVAHVAVAGPAPGPAIARAAAVPAPVAGPSALLARARAAEAAALPVPGAALARVAALPAGVGRAAAEAVALALAVVPQAVAVVVHVVAELGGPGMDVRRRNAAHRAAVHAIAPLGSPVVAPSSAPALRIPAHAIGVPIRVQVVGGAADGV